MSSADQLTTAQGYFGDDLPLAVVTLGLHRCNEVSDLVWRLPQCPYCGGKHEHSAGDCYDSRYETLGSRVAHCDYGEADRPREYVLCPQERLPARIDGKVKDADRSAMSQVKPSLRFMVLLRDGFRCTYCGALPTDGAVLQVDHVVPRCKGGRSVIANLRTACRRCNVGKGGRDYADL